MKHRRLMALGVLLAASVRVWSADAKLIALTFDDGPRPEVLFAERSACTPSSDLLAVLDKNQAKATFFVMGWRLKPGSYPDCDKTRSGLSCRDAARELVHNGYEVENHTYSHIAFPIAAKRHGEDWILSDVDRGAAIIQAATGIRPRFLRPPDWEISREMRHTLESRGYRVLTIDPAVPLALRDVNSLDYLCAGRDVSQCPKPSLMDSVLRQIAQRERRGVFTHVLAFHELPSTVTTLESLLPALRARGYRFVRLDEYMREVDAHSAAAP